MPQSKNNTILHINEIITHDLVLLSFTNNIQGWFTGTWEVIHTIITIVSLKHVFNNKWLNTTKIVTATKAKQYTDHITWFILWTPPCKS